MFASKGLTNLPNCMFASEGLTDLPNPGSWRENLQLSCRNLPAKDAKPVQTLYPQKWKLTWSHNKGVAAGSTLHWGSTRRDSPGLRGPRSSTRSTSHSGVPSVSIVRSLLRPRSTTLPTACLWGGRFHLLFMAVCACETPPTIIRVCCCTWKLVRSLKLRLPLAPCGGVRLCCAKCHRG